MLLFQLATFERVKAAICLTNKAFNLIDLMLCEERMISSVLCLLQPRLVQVCFHVFRMEMLSYRKSNL